MRMLTGAGGLIVTASIRYSRARRVHDLLIISSVLLLENRIEQARHLRGKKKIATMRDKIAYVS